jgi:hypothetical protein
MVKLPKPILRLLTKDDFYTIVSSWKKKEEPWPDIARHLEEKYKEYLKDMAKEYPYKSWSKEERESRAATKAYGWLYRTSGVRNQKIIKARIAEEYPEEFEEYEKTKEGSGRRNFINKKIEEAKQSGDKRKWLLWTKLRRYNKRTSAGLDLMQVLGRVSLKEIYPSGRGKKTPEAVAEPLVEEEPEIREIPVERQKEEVEAPKLIDVLRHKEPEPEVRTVDVKRYKEPKLKTWTVHVKRSVLGINMNFVRPITLLLLGLFLAFLLRNFFLIMAFLFWASWSIIPTSDSMEAVKKRKDAILKEIEEIKEKYDHKIKEAEMNLKVAEKAKNEDAIHLYMVRIEELHTDKANEIEAKEAEMETEAIIANLYKAQRGQVRSYLGLKELFKTGGFVFFSLAFIYSELPLSKPFGLIVAFASYLAMSVQKKEPEGPKSQEGE